MRIKVQQVDIETPGYKVSRKNTQVDFTNFHAKYKLNANWCKLQHVPIFPNKNASREKLSLN